MRIFLTTAYQQGGALRFLREAALRDRLRVHEICEDAERADAVLFVENGELADPYYAALRRHPLVARRPDRVFMYNEYDFPYCVLPGLYTSMPRRSFDATRQVAFPYLFLPNEFIPGVWGSDTERDLLFSFMGAPNHRVRRRLFAITDPRAYIEDTTAFSIWSANEAGELMRRKRLFADVIARSQFVLCPRGAGTSSYRLFESMQAGRAPVVIGDQWVAPAGPDWDAFLVRIPESAVHTLPQRLRALEGEALARGAAAREAWERWFAPDVIFHHAVECVQSLLDRPVRRAAWKGWLPDRELLRIRASRAVVARAREGRSLLRRLRGVLRPAGRPSA